MGTGVKAAACALIAGIATTVGAIPVLAFRRRWQSRVVPAFVRRRGWVILRS